MKIYRLEFEDGFGPHNQDKLKCYIDYDFFHKKTIEYKSLEEYHSDVIYWIKNCNHSIDMYELFCAFVDQNSLLKYIEDAFEFFINNGGKIVEIEIDPLYCFVAEDKQAFFIYDKIEQKRSLL